MVDIRPHRLQVIVTTGGGEDENGDPIPVTNSGVGKEIPCRIIQDEKANTRIQPDGTFRFYQYCVVLDDITTNYDRQNIKLLDENGNVFTERIVDCSKMGLLIQRLWL